MKMKKNHVVLWLTLLLLSFLLGAFGVTYFYYKEYHFAERFVRHVISMNHNYAPYNTNVKFESSTLPIISIECGEMQKREYIPAKMMIFPNGGTFNQVLDNGEGGHRMILLSNIGDKALMSFQKNLFQ